MRGMVGMRRMCHVFRMCCMRRVFRTCHVFRIWRMYRMFGVSRVCSALQTGNRNTRTGHAASGGTGHQSEPPLRQGARVRHVTGGNEGTQQGQHDEQAQPRMNARAGRSSSVVKPGHDAMILAIVKAGRAPPGPHGSSGAGLSRWG